MRIEEEQKNAGIFEIEGIIYQTKLTAVEELVKGDKVVDRRNNSILVIDQISSDGDTITVIFEGNTVGISLSGYLRVPKVVSEEVKK